MSTKVQGFSVRIFLPQGDPDGLKIVEKSNWTGCGLVFPRSLFSEAKKRPELQRTGVYVLVGPGEKTHLPRVYIGEGDPVRPRIDQHAKSKDFWTHVITFSSKDQNLNKADVQYLEARLIELASVAKRCELDNGNVPQLPSLSEADIAEAEGFLEDILLCFPVLGVPYFERASGTASRKADLFIRAKGVEARGFESPQGFVVRQGSQSVKNEVASIQRFLSDLRAALVEKGVLAPSGGAFVFAQDYVFSSPSSAGGVVLGRSTNGRAEWKNAQGLSLKELQDAEAGS